MQLWKESIFVLDAADPVDVYKVSAQVNGQNVFVNLLDTSGKILPRSTCALNLMHFTGQEEFKGMRQTQIELNEGFMLVYSINDRRGFEDLKV